jgi:putative nucleotidyltransferase with HDIG domain
MSVQTGTPRTTAPAGERVRVDARAVAGAAERLAAPSTVVAGVLELIGGSAPVRAIAQRVAQSPEVAAHVLRLANSALFGEPVDTLDRAIVRIGEKNLKGLLLAASTYRLLESDLRLYGLARLALLRHSTEVAQMAQEVAARIQPAVAPQAYLAGLMHDIGKPILADVAAHLDGLPAMRTTADERGLFGTDHARVGLWVANRWSLPEEICEAMGHHHDGDAPEGVVARAVWLADLVAHASSGDGAAIARLPRAAESCGVELDQLESLLTRGADPEERTAPATLTDRELQVLRLLATGAAAKQVALQLGCSLSTVHNHLHHVYKKLNVTGQAQALLMAREMGWV